MIFYHIGDMQDKDDENSRDEKVVITGGSTGVGADMALRLQQQAIRSLSVADAKQPLQKWQANTA